MKNKKVSGVGFQVSGWQNKRGFMTIFVLIASAVFFFLLSDFMSALTLERTKERFGSEADKALSISEAGIEYYRWHFSEFPTDVQDGTGSSGLYVHAILDPESGATVGNFSLAISSITSCGVLTSATVRSTGWASENTSHTKTLIGTYGTETLAASTSPAKSDTAVISATLTNLKTYAQASGVYLAPTSDGAYGYKIVFKSNGTFDASPVTAVTEIVGYSTDDGWEEENTIIASTGPTTNYAIPAGCPVVFVQDSVWLEGVVSGRVTFAAANMASPSINPDIVITGNITYAHAYDDGLTAIAERSVLISLQSPDVLQMNGVFVAGTGHFGRHRYDSSGTHAVPAGLQSYVLRSTLNTFGTFASPGTVETKWTSSGAFISGYSTRTDVHDALLAQLPPPFTPATASGFRIIDWRTQD